MRNVGRVLVGCVCDPITGERFYPTSVDPSGKLVKFLGQLSLIAADRSGMF